MIDEKTEAKIRRLFFAEHFKVGTISTQLGLHHSVVTRVIGTDQMVSKTKVFPSALDPFIALISDTLKVT